MSTETEIQTIFLKNKPDTISELQNFLINNNNTNNTRAYDYLEGNGDIFSIDKNIAIGNYVSKCFTMSQGISLKFDIKFNNKNT